MSWQEGGKPYPVFVVMHPSLLLASTNSSVGNGFIFEFLHSHVFKISPNMNFHYFEFLWKSQGRARKSSKNCSGSLASLASLALMVHSLGDEVVFLTPVMLANKLGSENWEPQTTMSISGKFHRWWYLKILGRSMDNPHLKWMISGYFRKPPWIV